MASRTISLEQSAYERLAAEKRPGESFTDVVNRLAGREEPSILDLAGILSPTVGKRLAEDVARMRKEQAELSEERRRRFWPEP